ncbi:MAG TPA: alkaline phosphatase family protein, partial [Candidatus Nitrosotalea sp.]|nr:alkaline phosphatase family protein [Candidatus Nitrosotalea sp.]
SFNDLFAGFPGANSAMQGLCKPNPPYTPWCKVAREVPLKPLALAQGSPTFGGEDICHSHQCFVIECDPTAAKVCRMDGFDLIDFGESQGGQAAKLYPYAYVRRSDVKAYWSLAKAYTLADETFFTETAASFIAHQVLIAGSVELNNRESLTDQPQTFPWGCDAPTGAATPVLFKNDRYGQYHFNGPPPCFTYSTIADLLDAKSVDWRYYVDPAFGVHADFSGAVWNGYRAIKKIFYGPDWKADMRTPNTKLFEDVKTGKLPAVSWVIPSLNDSDHPASGCNGGPYWVTKVVNAIGTSSYWKNTAILVLWDDWGGWYDNAPPQWLSYTRLGFRVPMIVISPYAKANNVAHTHYDFGSILKFVEETFGLGSLGTTDAMANSMQDAFDFTQRPINFQPAPLPPVMSCGKLQSAPAAMHQIIERAGGAPD